MIANRSAVLDQLAAGLSAISLGRPVRVAIDGRTASGKTTLADEIASLVRAKGRPAIRTSIDGFHRPKAERYARGRYSAEGYFYDARDLAAIMTFLLIPLGPGGDRLYRTQSFDLENDVPVEQEPQLAPTGAILIVDGTFLQRRELRDGWDVTIFAKTSENISERRGVGRDADRLGGKDVARQLYAKDTALLSIFTSAYARQKMTPTLCWSMRIFSIRRSISGGTEDWREACDWGRRPNWRVSSRPGILQPANGTPYKLQIAA